MLLAVLAAGVLAAANVLAAGPALLAARSNPGQLLRTECAGRLPILDPPVAGGCRIPGMTDMPARRPDAAAVPHPGGRGRVASRLGLGLSRELWLVEAGIFLNSLGYGAVLPFEVIYLHDGRGFSLGVAGLVVGAIMGVAVAAAPADRPAHRPLRRARRQRSRRAPRWRSATRGWRSRTHRRPRLRPRSSRAPGTAR